MKTDGKSPDAYFACDVSFMKQVHDLFLEATPVSTNQLVILVPKGNPHQIHSLNDLGKPGLPSASATRSNALSARYAGDVEARRRP